MHDLQRFFFHPPAEIPARRFDACPRAPRPLPGIVAGILLAVAPFASLQAAGEVSSLRLDERPGTPFMYSAGGDDFAWGVGSDRLLTGFISDDRVFGQTLSADRVELSGGAGSGDGSVERCLVFAERVDGDAARLAPSFPGDGADAADCDMAVLLGGDVFNRGALDLFANATTDGVERVDYLFDSGILAPVTPEGLSRAGHVVAEKGGDSRLKIAAVLSLDMLGRPASYGPLVLARASGCMDPEFCYGVTDVHREYSFFENGAPSDTARHAGGQASESVTMAFVSNERLGLHAGQRYFGFSLFADDVDTDDHDPVHPDTFPVDTGGAPDTLDAAADVHGGLSGWFIDEALSNGSGRVFLDENEDGVPNDDEAGIGDIRIQLYRDTDGDGLFDPRRDEPVCSATNTDASGLFVLPGLPDGNYFVVLRENDPELPSGITLAAGDNPLPFAIAGGDVDDLHFAFTGGAGGNGDGGDPDADGDTDAGPDGDSEVDGDTDAGPDGDTEVDGGPDTGVDGDTDSDGDTGTDGDTDAGPDGDTEADGGPDTDADGDIDTDVDTDVGSGPDADVDGETDTDVDTDVDGGPGTDTGGDADTDVDGGVDPDGGTDTDTDGDDAPDPNASLDDTVTRAERDRFDVQQDVPTLADVLANDSDGAGAGLTIVAVADPVDGTAEIVNGVNGEPDMILYTPDPGFFGSDSFVYEIRDGDGAAFSGTATANVIRFSDVNRNTFNDFIECECSDLTLETGVHGSGIGRTSFGLLAAIAGVTLLRRRRGSPGRRTPDAEAAR